MKKFHNIERIVAEELLFELVYRGYKVIVEKGRDDPNTYDFFIPEENGIEEETFKTLKTIAYRQLWL